MEPKRIYSNLKNFSLFNFEIFQLIHCYSQILGVSLEPCRRSICLLFQISFIVTAILRRFTVTLYFYRKNNAYISLLLITSLK